MFYIFQNVKLTNLATLNTVRTCEKPIGCAAIVFLVSEVTPILPVFYQENVFQTWLRPVRVESWRQGGYLKKEAGYGDKDALDPIF